MNNKSFDEFWAKFLQITFHRENPDRWPSRQSKANWCQNHLQLNPQDQILDLGCGDGLIDIWLSRMGYQVTAVDRNQSVLDHARSEDDTRKVEWVCSDLRRLNFKEKSFQSALFIESCGLMKNEDDIALINHVKKWLVPGGKLIIDCPESAEVSNSWAKQFSDGEISAQSSFDIKSRIQRIEFFFKSKSGEEFGLYDPMRDQQPGITRYLYPKEELKNILEDIGFEVREIPHYYPKNYYAFVATKP